MTIERTCTSTVEPVSLDNFSTPRKRKLVFGSESIPDQSKRVRLSLAPSSTPAIFGIATGRFEDYFILCSAAPLGSGRFGAVRKCVSKATGEAFACKTLQRRELIGEAGRDDVRREVRMLQQVSGHPGIVQLYGVFEDATEVHIVTELCDGGELFDDVVRRGRLPEKEAAQVFMQVASAVAFCHSRGIVHRDIKPENILLCFDRASVSASAETAGILDSSSTRAPKSAFVLEPAAHLRVKLADFGLALSVGRGGHTRGAAGSPAYMAPEVFSGEYGCAADVWSLGVVLHVLLTGAMPFWGEDADRTAEGVLNGRLDLSGESGVWAGVSAEARGLIRCMLERDPRRRPTASKVLSHPWLLLHAFGGRIVRKAVGGRGGMVGHGGVAVPAAAATNQAAAAAANQAAAASFFNAGSSAMNGTRGLAVEAAGVPVGAERSAGAAAEATIVAAAAPGACNMPVPGAQGEGRARVECAAGLASVQASA